MRKAKSLDPTLTIDADIRLISEKLKKINNRNYYEVMGLPKNATPEEIKKAYKEWFENIILTDIVKTQKNIPRKKRFLKK